MNIIKTIKEVLAKEILVLEDVKTNINEPYSQVVELIFNSTGKLIILGVGKSGIVAKKIVATMISTGTSAFFLHPTEAMHGDLGIVNKNDIIFAISKSGNSQEIVEVIPAIKKIGAKIVALTSNKDSKLAQKSDYILFMPVKEEACPLNLAPTSSTTATIAIGDAIAVALMELRGFKKENFASFHPGGELGQKVFFKVRDIMRTGKKNPIVSLDLSIDQMFDELTQKMMGAVSVVDDNGFLKGIITDYDIRRIFQDKKDIYKLNLQDIMNSNPSYIFSDDSAYNALEFMEKRKKPISVLPVVDKETKKVVGMVHLHDIVG
jgi:arabinose-5-phosphate isomerase